MKYKINLTKHKAKNLEERVVFFSLNYFRYIIVIAQLFVIMVFFYRFKVDQQIVDLNEQVRQKEEIIKVSSPLIEEGERLSKISDIIAAILVKQNSFKGMVDYVIKRIPQGVTLTKLDIKKNSVQVEGNSETADYVKLMVERLNEEHKFSQVKLMGIERKIVGFHFILSLKDYPSSRVR